MAAPVYATPAEYEDSPYGVAEPGEDLAARLAIASRQLDAILTTAVYDVDDAEQPTDEGVAEAMRDATIAQASHLIDPTATVNIDAGQIPSGYASVNIGPVTLTKGAGGAVSEVVSGPIAYAPMVVVLLYGAGLLPGRVWMA